jgi:hypothetical protein
VELEERIRKRGGDLEKGLIFVSENYARGEEGGGRNSEGDREEGGNWKNNCFEELSQGIVVAGNFGLGAMKPQGFLELGSQRGCPSFWEVNIQLGSLGKHKNK